MDIKICLQKSPVYTHKSYLYVVIFLLDVVIFILKRKNHFVVECQVKVKVIKLLLRRRRHHLTYHPVHQLELLHHWLWQFCLPATKIKKINLKKTYRSCYNWTYCGGCLTTSRGRSLHQSKKKEN